VFNKSWAEQYFFRVAGFTAVYLICGDVVSLFKVLNLEYRFTLNHEGHSANLSSDARTRKAKELVLN
jgi:hypothetical protein